MARLVSALGGKDRFVKRLQLFHETGHLNAKEGLLDIGDEQAYLTIYQFHYAGRPALSSECIHSYIPHFFNESKDGIPGNDDSGAMGAFVVLAMMGLYPVHGTDVYLITPPFFEEITITHPLTKKKATIRNKNFDPAYNNIYIQRVERDGESWTKNWIQHDFFTEGGLLELTLGDKESEWGTHDGDLPPSVSTEQAAPSYEAKRLDL
jgi:putative alpha-1,2-mannosidase